MADDKVQLLRRFGLHAAADELERKQGVRRVRCRCKPPNICPTCVPHAQRQAIKAMNPGDRNGKLILLRRYVVRGGARWSCWCDCGNLLVVKAWEVDSGTRKSCGSCARYYPPKRGSRRRASRR